VTYDNELVLIDHTYAENEIGNSIPSETRTTILCGEKSVSRREFYSAAASNLRPEVVLVVHSFEYNGQTDVEYKGIRYKVIRTFSPNAEETELTVEKV
jgi:SPP1 family predicted phage head-tail adaptor